MATTIAEGLRRLLETTPPAQPVRVNILLRSDLAPAETREAAERIRQIVGGVPCMLLESSNNITATVPAGHVPQIAEMDSVFWIDVDHEAPLEALIDS